MYYVLRIINPTGISWLNTKLCKYSDVSTTYTVTVVALLCATECIHLLDGQTSIVLLLPKMRRVKPLLASAHPRACNEHPSHQHYGNNLQSARYHYTPSLLGRNTLFLCVSSKHSSILTKRAFVPRLKLWMSGSRFSVSTHLWTPATSSSCWLPSPTAEGGGEEWWLVVWCTHSNGSP